MTLPFRFDAPGKDTIDIEGIRSVSYRADGLLHLTGDGVTLEWTETRTVDEVSLEGIGTRVSEGAPEYLDLPIERIAGAWIIGGWWWPRLELRSRGLDDFAEVPGSRGVTLRLRIQRRDRALAHDIAQRIQAGAAPNR